VSHAGTDVRHLRAQSFFSKESFHVYDMQDDSTRWSYGGNGIADVRRNGDESVRRRCDLPR
jgi:hypothetical protein